MSHEVMLEQVELVGLGVAATKEPQLVMSMRLDPDSPIVSNLALSAKQTVRLWNDLCLLMANKESLKKAAKKYKNDGYSNFVEFVDGKPCDKPPTKINFS